MVFFIKSLHLYILVPMCQRTTKSTFNIPPNLSSPKLFLKQVECFKSAWQNLSISLLLPHLKPLVLKYSEAAVKRHQNNIHTTDGRYK